MVATCSVGAMLYVLPMMLGRTYDMKSDSVGIDIYDKKDIDDATNNPIANPEMRSYYLSTEDQTEKRKFLGISGDLSLKVSSGLVDIRGAGEYLKDTSNADKKVEILVKMTFTTQIRELSPDAKPLEFWKTMSPDLVGTHVVTSITYGGEVFASINFVATNQSNLQEIKGEVEATFSKEGAFDIDAQGKVEKLAKKISSKAKMEIDYYGTVPLDNVPTTTEGLKNLVKMFRDQVQRVNKGVGVAVCAGFRPLSDFSDKFTFMKNRELTEAFDDFNYKFANLREARSILRSFVGNLPEDVPDAYIQKIMDFSERLSKTLNEFHKVIANLNMEEGSEQLSPADKAFDDNSRLRGVNKYTKEIKKIISEYTESETVIKPRAIYTHWGKRTCDNQASNIVYIGYMASNLEMGIGSGTNYQCLPENPKLKTDYDTSGVNAKTSKLAAVRYSNMSMFRSSKQLQDKVVPCCVCETLMRPTVRMFPGMSCPGDWVQEYRGYVASNAHGRMRAENVCINIDPDTYNTVEKIRGDPVLMPVKMGESKDDKFRKDASISCSVCSK